MRAFIAMDTDGTVNPVGSPPGPVPVSLLYEIALKHKVMAVGNPSLQSLGFEGITANGVPTHGISVGKSGILQTWKQRFPGFDRYVVVDDMPEQYGSGWDGWEFMKPDEFMQRVKEFL